MIGGDSMIWSVDRMIGASRIGEESGVEDALRAEKPSAKIAFVVVVGVGVGSGRR